MGGNCLVSQKCICCDLRKQTPAKSVSISLGVRARVCVRGTGLCSEQRRNVSCLYVSESVHGSRHMMD